MDAVVRYLLQNPTALRRRSEDEEDATNEAMVKRMEEEGVLKSERVKQAFLAVDRKLFVPDKEKASSYAPIPLRDGLIHISAPPMYSEMLENLMPMDRGMSFLNIGSGTG